MKLFVDTWAWLNLADPNEPRHSEVLTYYRERASTHGATILTSDYVLDELITRLFRRRAFFDATAFVQGILRSAAEKHIVLARVTETRFTAALALRMKYADKPRVSFTDWTTMAIMTEFSITDVLTADLHFQQVGLGFRLLPE